MRKLMEHTARKKRVLVDGVRFITNGSHITIKPDRYKASFYVQVESRSAVKAKENLATYITNVKKWQVLEK